MGRHIAANTEARQGLSIRYMCSVGALALTLGIGAAVASGAGTANAEGPIDNSTGRLGAQSPRDSSSRDGTAKGPAAVKSPTATSRDAQRHRLRIASAPAIGPRAAAGRPGSPGITPPELSGLSTSPVIVQPTVSPTRTGLTATGATENTYAATYADVRPVRLAIVPAAVPFKQKLAAPPTPRALDVLQLARREIENIALSRASSIASFTSAQAYAIPSIVPGVPTPTDQAPTVYGDIGKWMLESNGQISDYGGQQFGGRTLFEPVNVIIVDPTSRTSWQAAVKLNVVMFWAGFPAQPIHSTGFRGVIDGTSYGQQPRGLIRGYSDNLFIFPNDHGRIFGPDPVQTSTGYVWSGAFSTEQLGLYNGLPAHTYVSSNMARTVLAMHLILCGLATFGGFVPLNNSYDTATTTTGDHDGYAVVLILR